MAVGLRQPHQPEAHLHCVNELKTRIALARQRRHRRQCICIDDRVRGRSGTRVGEGHVWPNLQSAAEGRRSDPPTKNERNSRGPLPNNQDAASEAPHLFGG